MLSIYFPVCFLFSTVPFSYSFSTHSSIIHSLYSTPLSFRQNDPTNSEQVSKCSESGSCPSNQHCALFSDSVSACFPGICVQCLSDSDCDSLPCAVGACTSSQTSCDENSDCADGSRCLSLKALPQISGVCIGGDNPICISSSDCVRGSSCFSLSYSTLEKFGWEVDGRQVKEAGIWTSSIMRWRY